MENEGEQRTAGVIKGAVLGRGMPVDATLQLDALCHLGLAYALAHRGVKRQEFDRYSCFAMRTPTRRASNVFARRRRACARLLEAVAMPIACVVRRGCSLHGCQNLLDTNTRPPSRGVAPAGGDL
jgi:hypothetical protein